MAYKLTRKAAGDVTGILIEGTVQFGDAQAARYHGLLESAFELIAANPYLARERHEIDPPVRVFPAHSHLVIYVVDDRSDMLIIRVRHGREDWKQNPSGE
ncbi:type II toxin-antitoxin system RelE/ParE family toxin [Pannonibacter carbonis]|uniref:type II toxin-antitoxin system RelE/ParE family toxin n=1 Tax=Pannonibacter carbonis TaxID=2067569 RepID=UPI000D0FB592|nr:type II toxin-antitoxin system RelE/ParE family toxin [Pannonibacter carbonis]